MKRLPVEISKGGFTLKEHHRIGDIAIYEQRKHGGLLAYEIIRIQSHNGRDIAGVYYPPAEFYPSSEQWGTEGFTEKTMEDAISRMKELLRKEVTA